MDNSYDVIVIGSGLGGLLCANTLCMEGKRVLVLEKNNQIGGNLQVFKRDGVLFDTGVHYIGGLGAGNNLHQIFTYHGIMQELELEEMSPEGFDQISFAGDSTPYTWHQGYEAFEANLIKHFPQEANGIKQYTAKMREFCDSFPMYNLKNGSIDPNDGLLRLNARDFIHSVVQNTKLRGILAGNNLLYAGHPSKTPFYVHALVCNSYIQSSHKIKGGGGQIAQALAKKIRLQGGKIKRYQKVTNISTENNQVTGIVTESGEQFQAPTVISNVHPVHTFQMVEKGIRKATIKRLLNTDNTISSFSVHIVLKPDTIPYLNKNIYHFKREDVWNNHQYEEKDWPVGMMISCPSEKKSSDYAKGLSLLMYMNMNDFEAWKDTYNTVASKQNRGENYEALKMKKAEQALAMLYEVMPEVEGNIENIYTSSPLSYRDYIGSPDGSMYGIQNDCDQPLGTMLNPTTRVNGLLLTGQNLNLHGILGVSMSALKTCGEIIGLDEILKQVHHKNKVH